MTAKLRIGCIVVIALILLISCSETEMSALDQLGVANKAKEDAIKDFETGSISYYASGNESLRYQEPVELFYRDRLSLEIRFIDDYFCGNAPPGVAQTYRIRLTSYQMTIDSLLRKKFGNDIIRKRMIFCDSVLANIREAASAGLK